MKPTWAVVATVDEPGTLVVAFAAYHLAQGAQAVHLFLDRPNPTAETILRHLPRCHVTLCDAAYWARTARKMRPPLHVGRQTVNANGVYRSTDADFLLHCDCDEFVADADAMVAELEAAPEKAQYMRLRVAERVYPQGEVSDDLFAGVFRKAVPDYDLIGPAIYGADADFFKDGLTGHKAGKALSRTGCDLELSIHATKGKLPHRSIEGTHLLHFDGLTRLHYMLKLLRRANEPKVPWVQTPIAPRHGRARIAQIEELRDRLADPQSCADLVARMKEITAQQADILRQLAVLDERRFDPRPLLARMGVVADLSCAAFDVELLERNAEFLALHAPGWPH